MDRAGILTMVNNHSTTMRSARFGTMLIMLLAFFFAHSPTYAAPNAPTIAISPDTLYPLEEILYVEGRSDPNATVNAVLQKQGENPLRFTVKADQLGEWVIAEKVSMAKGDWELRARTVDGQEASEWSNPRIIRVVVTGFTVGSYAFSFFNASIAFILLLVAGFLFLLYAIIHVRNVRHRERDRIRLDELKRLRGELRKKEVAEAEATLAEGFSEIKEDLLTELHSLDARAVESPLSQQEILLRERIVSKLYDIEQKISKEIRDLESTP